MKKKKNRQAWKCVGPGIKNRQQHGLVLYNKPWLELRVKSWNECQMSLANMTVIDKVTFQNEFKDWTRQRILQWYPLSKYLISAFSHTCLYFTVGRAVKLMLLCVIHYFCTNVKMCKAWVILFYFNSIYCMTISLNGLSGFYLSKSSLSILFCQNAGLKGKYW